MSIGIFSFFSGAGFLDLGFEGTKGFTIDFANEINSDFVRAYQYSREKLGFNPPTYGIDIDNINNLFASKKLKVIIQDSNTKRDLIGFIGGPPCPDFSVGGKNKGRDGENGKLSQTYIDLICTYHPDFFLFENVKGLYRTDKHRAFFELLKNKLRKNNYILTECLVNAIEYGAPQDRDRIILIGFKSELLLNMDIEDASEVNLKRLFNWKKFTKYDKGQVFKMNWPQKSTFGEDKYLDAPNGIARDLTVQYWFEKNNVYLHPNAENCFNPKSNKFDIIEEGDDSKKSYKRLHRWRYSPTAAYGNNEVHLHPYKARRLSGSEALAIQSLPKDFELPVDMTLTDMFKTIGNGVPFLVAKGLAETIIDFLNPQKNGKTNSKQHSQLYQSTI